MNFWESVLCASLASLLAIILGGLYMIGAFRKRKPNEPPLDKGFIPWLGHGISFKKSPIAFLEAMWQKHGDIFTCLVGGNYLHFVLDPGTYEHLTKQSEDKLDFLEFASIISFNTFGYRPHESHTKVARMSGKHLRGRSLAILNHKLVELLQPLMLHSQRSREGQRSWQEDGLFRFSYKTIFQAAFLTLFGTEPENKENAKGRELTRCEELFEMFLKFDHFVPRMALGMLDPSSKKEAERLRNIFWDILSVGKVYQKENISTWVSEHDRLLGEIGLSENTRTKIMFLVLWVSQVNTGPAVFWILAYLLKYPEAMKAVKEEVDGILREIGQEVKPGYPFTHLTLDMIKTPLLDSAIQETLRLRVSPFLFRGVKKDVDVKLANGRKYILRKGDAMLLSPFLALHMDPEIHPEPHAFKYDRFVNPDGTRKDFYKNGGKLKHCIMPFGAGHSMCLGRFFAVSEMKIFAILMLSYFDMELVNPEEEIPPVDESSYGFGTLKPSHDIQFKYQLRI
ncbi:7-alpha-hydroxycholest-4-en-3-one 12-alpha-hydroxylase-like [Sceloporus undulatus]|uniref:7-alpha-hydroxycholest-4-en-3-one 12-alpha-hydroxylase-like n=1 Tax=Sceloporus undulatus TaxID=8520 RepID=UPI001C4BCDEF|nr:7-alpha-hydroxycholest-4-en-3-one 12-alpha-hydroxylase-like [Sceloporus undulatus]